MAYCSSLKGFTQNSKYISLLSSADKISVNINIHNNIISGSLIACLLIINKPSIESYKYYYQHTLSAPQAAT